MRSKAHPNKEYSANTNYKINRNLRQLRYKLYKSNPELLEPITDALLQASKGKVEPCKMVVTVERSSVIISIIGYQPTCFSGKATCAIPDIIGCA